MTASVASRTMRAGPGEQLRSYPPFGRIAATEGALATAGRLDRPLSPTDAHEFGDDRRWSCFYHLLVADADEPPARPAQLVPVATRGGTEPFAS